MDGLFLCNKAADDGWLSTKGVQLGADNGSPVKNKKAEASSGAFLIAVLIAATALSADVILSMGYYSNPDKYDMRWILALLDLVVILGVYSMMGGRVQRLLISMKLAVTLLFVVAILSIIGTYLPQGDDVVYSGWVNNSLYDFYRHLGLFNMYSSRWFMFVMFLLVFNLSFCIYKRIPTVIKHALKPRIDVRDSYVSSQPFNAVISGDGEWTMEEAETILGDHHFRIKKGETGSVLAEKGRFAGVFSICFHLSFLFIGVGAILISFFGWEEMMQIPDGARAQIPNTNLTVLSHGFQYEVEEIVEDGRVVKYLPISYSTDLELFEDGKSVARKTIAVNDPLRYSGVNFHQASYSVSSRGYATVLSINKSPGKTLIYIGFGMMMGAIVFALYFPHRRIWLKISDKGELLVGGRTKRAKMSFQRDFEQIVTELRLTSGQEAGSNG